MYKNCPNKASLSESHTRDLQTDLDQQQQDASTKEDEIPVQLVYDRSTPVTQNDSQKPLNSENDVIPSQAKPLINEEEYETDMSATSDIDHRKRKRDKLSPMPL